MILNIIVLVGCVLNVCMSIFAVFYTHRDFKDIRERAIIDFSETLKKSFIDSQLLCDFDKKKEIVVLIDDLADRYIIERC